mgnify:CR=1 FL=1
MKKEILLFALDVVTQAVMYIIIIIIFVFWNEISADLREINDDIQTIDSNLKNIDRNLSEISDVLARQ